MVNQEILSGHWNELKGQLKRKWGSLTDDDLRVFDGNVDQLVGRIQQKTGESREAIVRFLDDLAEEGNEFLADARHRVEEVTQEAANRARDGYQTLRQGYAEAGRVVQERPGQSLAVAFGLGLLSGLGLALLLRGQSHHSRIAHGRDAVEHFGKQVLHTMASTAPEAIAKRFQG